MKIGRKVIKGLTSKKTVAGEAYYWQPTPNERKAKWKGMPLGLDLSEAIKRAEARNDEIEDWKRGGAKPKTIDKFVKKATFGAIIKKYRLEKMAKLAANTQRVDETQIKRLEEWAGDQQVHWITRPRVKVLRNALAPTGEGDPGHGVAFKTLAKGRDIFAWAMDEELVTSNPFERFNLAKPDPRHQIWEADDITAFGKAADREGWPSVGLGVRLGTYTGQRQADILKLGRGDWKEITLRQLRFDQQLHDDLASVDGPDAGKVMGIRVKQNKTGRWIGAPIEGDMRREIEAAIGAALKRAADTGTIAAANILAHDKTGAPWEQRDFQDKVALIRAKAIEQALKDGDQALAGRLQILEFRDLRRTCVVTLGELGLDDAAIAAITGHKLATIKSILETYMPRTEAMAARGVVARIGQNSRDADRAELKERKG